jgi:hypothetical protein
MSKIETFERYLSKIIEGLQCQLLAADFESQVKALPDFVHVPDEVLNEYGNSFLLAKQVPEVELIDKSQYTMMQELDNALDDVPISESYEDALEAMSSTEWEAIRIKASDVLRSLGVEKRTPDLTHNVYVQGR